MFKINKSLLSISLFIIFMTGCSNFRKPPVELSKHNTKNSRLEYAIKEFCSNLEYIYETNKLKEKPYVLLDYFQINDSIEKYSFDVITDYNQTDFPPSLYKFNKHGFTIIFRNRSDLEECRDCKDMPDQPKGSAYWDLENIYLYYFNGTIKWEIDDYGHSSDKHELEWWSINPDSTSEERIIFSGEKLRL